MRILVIGGSGLVGSNLVEECERRGHTVFGTYRTSDDGDLDYQLDKTDEEATRNLVCELDPDTVVDTAAFHAVDDCENDRALAWRVNAAGTRNVATAVNDMETHLVYLSTDYVFPGRPSETPYVEDDPVAPLNYYARSKYAGEQATRIADQYTVLRPSVIYGLANGNFAAWALSELEAGEEIGIVNDQTSRPTYAPDLASAILDVAENDLTGLYHATGPESVSRYEFTRALAEIFGHDRDLVNPITSEELGQEAPRPRDSSLDSSALYNAVTTTFDPPTSAFERMAKRQ